MKLIECLLLHSMLLLLIVLTASSATTKQQKWLRKERGSLKQNIFFTIYLKQNEVGISKLENHLNQISDPNNKNMYGKHMSKEQVLEYVKPTNETIAHVENYLSNFKMLRQIFLGDAIQLHMNISEIEKMLPTSRFYNYQHSQYDDIIIPRTLPYDIPDKLKGHIDFISKLSEFRDLKKKKSTKTTKYLKDKDSINGKLIIPKTLNNLYNVPVLENVKSENFKNGNKMVQSVAEFQHALGPEGYNPNDMKKWQEEVDIITTGNVNIIGDNDEDFPNSESQMDIDFITGLNPSLSTTFWMNENWMLQFAFDLFNKNSTENRPSVVSISWGYPESSQCSDEFGPDMPANCTYWSTNSKTYVERTNIEFMKVTALGVTLVVSSGDFGAPGRINQDCSKDTGRKDILNPDFPASSPFVISVGATALVHPDTLVETSIPTMCNKFATSPCANGTFSTLEKVASTGYGSLITSAGGFSIYAKMPEYQKEEVNKYLKNSAITKPPTYLFNASNRAYPDVSALGHNFIVYSKGVGEGGYFTMDGTSCSAPTIAAILAHINMIRINNNRPVLGFANKWLYSIPINGFKILIDDNTSSNKNNNKCTGGDEASCCKYGYEVDSSNWDPVIGRGTPIVSEWIKFDETIFN